MFEKKHHWRQGNPKGGDHIIDGYPLIFIDGYPSMNSLRFIDGYPSMNSMMFIDGYPSMNSMDIQFFEIQFHETMKKP